ncbi:hypothetical protein BU24DRAFT_414234 [Aaosphaeria arxii CBS 175.79]|uniref:Uncharacterized protein n=1 Tax=Aaosphaeria arxii CBS 175.79 TaxID=1450172 RepID=A0A6A5XCN1_9PLEO|nr:uncharacterized protein BU24DRAFT_414234 [Aaosphaeria arxii CBS 175.79]KAF2010680.1 hypothetical protein BU24DRAFT_414234 [Aaosphaeria arxii CBS 175.79]
MTDAVPVIAIPVTCWFFWEIVLPLADRQSCMYLYMARTPSGIACFAKTASESRLGSNVPSYTWLPNPKHDLRTWICARCFVYDAIDEATDIDKCQFCALSWHDLEPQRSDAPNTLWGITVAPNYDCPRHDHQNQSEYRGSKDLTTDSRNSLKLDQTRYEYSMPNQVQFEYSRSIKFEEGHNYE